MRVNLFIEKYFGIFLIAGLLLGLRYSFYNDFLMSLLKPFLMIMLFLVFLRTDFGQIFQKMKNYRLIAFIAILNMLVIPVIFFLTINLFDQKLAIGILLLTSMPAGVASPALTEIVKGNTALSTSIVIITSILAPFTIPFLFWILKVENLAISPWWVFKDLAVIVFIPMITSQIVKRYFQKIIDKTSPAFTSINILVLFLSVYAVIGSQHKIIFSNAGNFIWQTVFLYLVFILLHIFGFFMGFKEDNKSKTAIAIGTAYMNNGMAIVLAAVYFGGPIFFLMVLSELPWNTLLVPFRKIVTNRVLSTSN